MIHFCFGSAQLLATNVFYFCPKTGKFLVLQFIFRNYVFDFVQTLFVVAVFADYGQATSNIMHFVTFLVFNDFYLIYFYNFILFFMIGRSCKNTFYFNIFYFVNKLLIFISCINIRKQINQYCYCL